MRILYATLFLVLSFSLSVTAQNIEKKIYSSIDLYEGMDEGFYSNSNFGVKNPIYSAYPVTGMIRHNRVDGLFLGYQEEKMDWNSSSFFDIENVDLHGLIGYSFAQNELQYTVGAEKSIGNHRKWMLIGGELHKTTATEDYWRSGIYENSITSFASGFDFHDYYKADGYGFYTLLRPMRYLELGASYNFDVFSSLEAATDFSLVSRYSSFRVNPAIDPEMNQASQQSVALGATLNPNGISKFSSISTTVSAKAEIADLKGSGNDFMYNRYQVEAKSFFRLDRSTLLKWRIMAGSITGTAPEFKNFALGGLGSLRALGYKSLNGNQMLLSNFEIEFGRSSTHKKGWPDLSSTYLSLFLDSGTSNVNVQNYTAKNPIEIFDVSILQLSHNAGIGLGLGMMKFELAKPIAGAQGHTSFWIRFNPTF
ncbi:MAG: hypothetical protein HUJ22_04480 [Gracilimonas sp.]|uniref:hypothetical protein n=1 Tax=Gracilimonas sp. TaxID=1974203 RepID=UPI0019AB2E55|nr:hypothetical protein [Gracilimonas sp.]MBD3615809.1 hypothetical protein [Gracilimonas sp.]